MCNCVTDFNKFKSIHNILCSNALSHVALPGVAAHSMIIEIWGGSFAAAPRASRAAWGQTKSGKRCDQNMGCFAFGKTSRGPRCAQQTRQRLAMLIQLSGSFSLPGSSWHRAALALYIGAKLKAAPMLSVMVLDLFSARVRKEGDRNMGSKKEKRRKNARSSATSFKFLSRNVEKSKHFG